MYSCVVKSSVNIGNVSCTTTKLEGREKACRVYLIGFEIFVEKQVRVLLRLLSFPGKLGKPLSSTYSLDGKGRKNVGKQHHMI